TREIKVSYQNTGFQDSRVRALKKATVASKRNSEQLQEQFEAMGGRLLSLLEARKDYYQAREKYTAALIEKDILRYHLLDAMGTLNGTLNIKLTKVAQ
ncbi:MAG: TolC family protein, partial [Emcibacter sp.]|nr:TolC family protein [Emcibacter sp.]